MAEEISGNEQQSSKKTEIAIWVILNSALAPCTVYLSMSQNSKYIKIFNKDQPIRKTQIRKMMNNGVAHLYIDEADTAVYCAYLQEFLQTINGRVAIEEWLEQNNSTNTILIPESIQVPDEVQAVITKHQEKENNGLVTVTGAAPTQAPPIVVSGELPPLDDSKVVFKSETEKEELVQIEGVNDLGKDDNAVYTTIADVTHDLSEDLLRIKSDPNAHATEDDKKLASAMQSFEKLMSSLYDVKEETISNEEKKRNYGQVRIEADHTFQTIAQLTALKRKMSKRSVKKFKRIQDSMESVMAVNLDDAQIAEVVAKLRGATQRMQQQLPSLKSAFAKDRNAVLRAAIQNLLANISPDTDVAQNAAHYSGDLSIPAVASTLNSPAAATAPATVAPPTTDHRDLDIEELKRQIAELKDENAKLKQYNKELQNQSGADETGAGMTAAESEAHPALNKKFAALEKKLEVFRQENKDLKGTISQQNATINEQKSSIATFQKLFEKMKEQQKAAAKKVS